MPRADHSDDDRVIELGSMSDPESGTDGAEEPVPSQPLPPTSSILRYVIAILAGAVVTLAITLVITEQPFTTRTTAPAPANMADLEEWLLDEVQDEAGEAATVSALWGNNYSGTYLALQPGAYRIAVKCGLLSQYGTTDREATLEITTNDHNLKVMLPCPSTTVWLDQGIEVDELSPMVGYARPGAEFNSFILAFAVVPDGGGR